MKKIRNIGLFFLGGHSFQKKLATRTNPPPKGVGEVDLEKSTNLYVAPKESIDIQNYYATFRRDVEAFRRKLPDLLSNIPGEYVAILDGEIVGHMLKWEDLVNKTQKSYPDKFVLLEHVVPRTQTVENMDAIEG